MLSKDELNASEALYGFTAWLSTLDREVVLNGETMAELIGLFVLENNLSMPREGWEDRLVRPRLTRGT